MASDFQKRFQRKIVDNEEEDEENEQEIVEKPVQLGFTEEKVDYHSEEEYENPRQGSQKSEENQRKTLDKPGYKPNYQYKPYKNPKKDHYKKPIREYVAKREEKETNNPDFKSWRGDGKPENKKKEYPEHRKYREEYEVVYVQKKNEEEKTSQNEKKISFKSTDLKNIKDFIPDQDRPTKSKTLRLNKNAMEFKGNFEEEEEENEHVFIGFQQPLDLVTANPPPLTVPFYQPPFQQPPFQQPYQQGFYPNSYQPPYYN